AAVARIAGTIEVRIGLVRIGHGGAVVPRAPPRLGSGHPESVAVDVRAEIAGVSDAVGVGIRLTSVRRSRAVVHSAGVRRETRTALLVQIGIGAGIAGIPEGIEVVVGLVGIRSCRTVVATVADTVAIAIGLRRIGHGDAVVGVAGRWSAGGGPVAVVVGIDAGVLGVRDA